jgi:threonine/homoserine/homoserine lactone efflux protein
MTSAGLNRQQVEARSAAMSHPFLVGVGLGLAIAAPVGPIGLLCIRRTLAEGRLVGLLTGLGAATADALYGALAAFGLTSLSGFLVRQQSLVGLIGGSFLCYLGTRTFLARPPENLTEVKSGSLSAAFGSTFLLTLTNPLTILSFAAVFAGLGIGARTADYVSAISLVAGVFTGSALWWLLLSAGVSLLRSRVDRRSMTWVNRVAGALIVLFGISAIVAALR